MRSFCSGRLEMRLVSLHDIIQTSACLTQISPRPAALLHAMRIGEGHRDVAIILVGALSRWVNHLEDEDMDKPRTKVLLKALRKGIHHATQFKTLIAHSIGTNLKLAIDYGLQKNQSDLLASFLQTLIMSEGEKWVRRVRH
jgi:hypothetical protein